MMTLLACLTVATAVLLLPLLATANEGDAPDEAIERTALPAVRMPTMNEDSRSTLVCSMYALLPALGHQGWSIPRLEALTGYAFYFQMREGGESVFDDSLDWGLAMHVLDIFGQAKAYDANQNSDVDLPALKAEARDAVAAISDQCVTARRNELTAFPPGPEGRNPLPLLGGVDSRSGSRRADRGRDRDYGCVVTESPRAPDRAILRGAGRRFYSDHHTPTGRLHRDLKLF